MLSRPVCKCGRKAVKQELCRSCYDAARYERKRDEFACSQRKYCRRREETIRNHRLITDLLTGWRQDSDTLKADASRTTVARTASR